MAYSSAADPTPKPRSRVRGRMRRSSASLPSAMLPSTKPVSVMRSQKRRRSPRKVNAKRPNAVPSARRVRELPRRKRGDHEPDDHEIAERGVQLRGLQVDHRDRALLTARAELGAADLTDEQRERQHREQGPRRKQAREHG